MITAQESYKLTIRLKDEKVKAEMEEIDAKISRARQQGHFHVEIYTNVSTGTQLAIEGLGYTVKEIQPLHQMDSTSFKISWMVN
jgi:hypothetical protein